MFVTPSLFVSARSARGTIVSVSVTLLFAAFASFAYVALAAFASEPVAVFASVQVALNVSVPLLPAIEFVVVAMLPLPLAVWHEPPGDAEQVHAQADRPAGNVSLTETPLTATVAGFVTTIA